MRPPYESLEFCKAARRVCHQWVGLCERRLRKWPPALEHQLHLIRGFIDMTNGKSGVYRASRRDGDEPPQKRKARRGVSFGLLKNPRRQPVRMRAIERR